MLAAGGYGLLPVSTVAEAQLLAFDCGKPNLNEFLRDRAPGMHASRLGLTSVVFHSDYQGAVAYFTLANDALPLKTSEAYDLGVYEHMPSFPAVKIGRLAVAQGLQGAGVGSAVMKLILGEVLDSSSLSSSRLLIVDAENDPQVIAFYAKHGFEKSLWAESQAKNHGGRASPAATVKMLRDVMA